MYIYLTAFYWATTTSATVGYGEISPINTAEKGIAILVIVAGVAYFSYILSDLATQFNELKKVSSMKSEREQ